MMRTILTAALGVCSLLAVALLSGGSTSVAQDAETVQVRARLVASGSIEFGLRAGGVNLTPRVRFFPAGDRATGWRVSSPLDLDNGAEVEILARRRESRAVEFAVRTVEPRQLFLPRERFFPRSARVGRWLISSPVSIPPPPEPEAEPQEQSSGTEPPVAEPETQTSTEQSGESTENAERINFGHREGLIVNRNVIGDPDAPVLIAEYGDPY